MLCIYQNLTVLMRNNWKVIPIKRLYAFILWDTTPNIFFWTKVRIFSNKLEYLMSRIILILFLFEWVRIVVCFYQNLSVLMRNHWRFISVPSSGSANSKRECRIHISSTIWFNYIFRWNCSFSFYYLILEIETFANLYGDRL